MEYYYDRNIPVPERLKTPEYTLFLAEKKNPKHDPSSSPSSASSVASSGPGSASSGASGETPEPEKRLFTPDFRYDDEVQFKLQFDPR